MRQHLVLVLLLSCNGSEGARVKDDPDAGGRDTSGGDPGSQPGDGGRDPDKDAADARVRTYAHDLDLDGTPDTDLTFSPCPTGTCLVADSRLPLAKTRWPVSAGTVTAGHIAPIGRHFPGTLQTIALHYVDSVLRPSIGVIDPNAKGLVAWVTAPEKWTLYDTWFAMVKGDGKRFPLLAPGQHYVPPADRTDWTFLCQFDPARIATPDPACGTGFRSAGTMWSGDTGCAAAGASFRHNGGWLDDVDGDGWDDIHLPYLWITKAVSGKTGATLSTSYGDVAPTPACFHSGRQYGSFASFTLTNGKRGTLVAAANAVGTFDDFFCNVSRYHALYVQDSPGSRSLAWSNYHAFSKGIYATLSPPVLSRKGDHLDRCVHRFSDSLYRAGDVPITMYSTFASDTPPNDCSVEQRAEIESGFQAEKMAAWAECAKTNWLPTAGTWSIQVLRAENGAGVNGWPNAYAWGTTTRLLKGGARVFLVETLAGKVRFDRKGHAPGKLSVVAVNSDFTWKQIGAFSIAGTPKVKSVEPVEGSSGASWGGLPELVTADRDGDGLDEVQLSTGEWIGWTGTAFARKP